LIFNFSLLFLKKASCLSFLVGENCFPLVGNVPSVRERVLSVKLQGVTEPFCVAHSLKTLQGTEIKEAAFLTLTS